jgi:thiol-disulfide isomerase/thioredoxin
MRSVVRALLLAACARAVLGKRAGDSGVADLTPATFDARTSAGEWLVAFTAPWCGHCKAAKPALREAAKELRGVVSFGSVDATRHRALAARFAIGHYPTFFFISANGTGSCSNKQQRRRILACSLLIPLLMPRSSSHTRRCARGDVSAQLRRRGDGSLRLRRLAC